MREVQQEGYRPLANARNLTKQQKELGPVSRGFKAMVTPILDVLRPSRKQNVIGNMRPTGNALGKYSVSTMLSGIQQIKLKQLLKNKQSKMNTSNRVVQNMMLVTLTINKFPLHNSVIQQQGLILVTIQPVLQIHAYTMQNIM